MQELSIKKPLRVGVLMGGISLEREVSLNSGRTICDHLDTQRYEIIPLFQTHFGAIYTLAWHFLHRGKTTDFVDRLIEESSVVSWEWIAQNVDILYLALHGPGAEDGTLQGMLELMNIPYVGSKVFASALRADKHKQKAFLNLSTITTPKGFVVPYAMINTVALNEYIDQQMTHNEIYYPVVIKPLHEGSSLGVQVVSEQVHLLNALQNAAFIDSRCPQNVLVEQKIEGIEFSCTVIRNKAKEVIALLPTEIIPDQGAPLFDYHQKYMPGLATKITPARFSSSIIDAIQTCAITCFNTLFMSDVARIDGFLTADQDIIIIDINALSGTDPSSFVFNQAAHQGMSHTQFINHIIDTALHSYGIFQESQTMHTLQNYANKMRIGVIMGGSNNEKETSLNSGRNVVYKLSPEKYEPIALFMHNAKLYKITQSQLVCHSTSAIIGNLEQSQLLDWSDLASAIDFAFIALHGGIGENGTLQGALETLGIPYNGSGVLASALCMNKAKTNSYLKHHGFEVPLHMLIASEEWHINQQHILTGLFNGPWVVKPHDDGCSVLVYKAYTLDEVRTYVQKIVDANKEYVMVEEYIKAMELSVGILGNDDPRVLPPTHTISAQGILSIEEKFLPGQGQNITPAGLSTQETLFVQGVLKNVYETIGCKGYARIDCFFQRATDQTMQRLIILEINTLPALTPATCLFHQAAEINVKPMELIDIIIDLGLQNYSKTFINCAMKNYEYNYQNSI